MRLKWFAFMLICMSLVACVNNELEDIELRALLEGNYEITTIQRDSVFTQAIAAIDTNTLQERLNLSGVPLGAIDNIRPNTVTLTLNAPSDSTFSFFRDMTLSLENDTDSIAFAEIGEFTTLTNSNISPRLLGNNVAPLLFADTFWVEMSYTIVADTTLDSLNIDFNIEWLVEGSFE